jgi:nucleobase:cation symporter-1, NCS1 family
MVTLAFTALLVYMLVKAGGIGPILHRTGSLGWGSKFWVVFWPSLMATIAYCAKLSLNMPDFTRFSKGQKQQVWGQVLGLPTTMSYIAIVSIIVTSAATVVYRTTI